MKRIFTAILSLALVSASFISCQPDEPEAVEKELGATTVQFLNTKNPEVFYSLSESKTYTLEHVISGMVEGTEPEVTAPAGWTAIYEVVDDVATVVVTAPATAEGAASGAVVIKGKDNIEREATATLNVLRREPDDVAFGNETFREFLAANFDTDGNGALSTAELQAITKLDLRGKELTPGFRYEGLGITSLAGIENLTGLKELYISNNSVGSVDLSKNTELEVLHCCFNGLSSLDLSKNTKIKELYCFHNDLTTLNLTAQPKLTVLDCQNNELTAVEFANGVALTSLNISKNQFESFDATKHAALTTFNCSNNLLTAIDITASKELTSFNAEANLLEAVDLSQATKLTTLNVVNNKLTALDLSACAALVELAAAGNEIVTADLGGCPALESVNLGDNALTSIAMSGLDNLKVLLCGNNQLTTIDFAGCPNLERLIANDNKIANIDLSAAKALKYAKVYNNPYTSICIKDMENLEYLSVVDYEPKEDVFSEGNIRYVRDASGTIQTDENGQPLRRFYFVGLKNVATLSLDLNGLGVTELYIVGNSNLVNLDISKFTELTNLQASGNKFASIDLSQNIALTTINLEKNNLQVVDLSGLENLVSANISGMNSLNSLVLDGVTPTLQELFVAKATDNAISWNKQGVGTLTIKGSNLKELAVSTLDTEIKSLKIYQNSNLAILDVDNSPQITDLQCYNNSLSTVDVSKCTELVTFNCNDNSSLSSIDLSNNPKLLTLDISNNRLASIDLSAQTALNKVTIKGTYLSGTLNLSRCAGLIEKGGKVDCSNNPSLTEVILPNGFAEANCVADAGVVKTIAGNEVEFEGGLE